MNCEIVHRRLLALERPESPPADLRQHLTVCAACRGWHEQFVSIEREVPFLPVPPPQRRADFLRTLRQTPRVKSRSRLFRPPLDSKRERGLRKVAIAVALAASLLVVALGAWFSKSEPANSTTKPPLARSPLEQRLEADGRWREAQSSRERVAVLNDLAECVEGEALALARGGSGEELRKQLRLYEAVIDQLTSKEAPQLLTELSQSDREKVLDPIARRLRMVESKARRLAIDTKALSEPLNELAHVAAEGDRKLRALLV